MTGKLIAVVRRLIAEATAPARFYALVRYRVVDVVAGRVNLQAVRKAYGAPDALLVSMQSGQPGGGGTLTPGALVLVSFVEGDPSLPVITHYGTPDGNAWLPLVATLDATSEVRIGDEASTIYLGDGDVVDPVGTDRVVRIGDTVTIPGVGVVTVGPAPPFTYSKAKG